MFVDSQLVRIIYIIRAIIIFRRNSAPFLEESNWLKFHESPRYVLL